MITQEHNYAPESFNPLEFAKQYEQSNAPEKENGMEQFRSLCKDIRKAFRAKSEGEQDKLDLLSQREKDAIMGKDEEVQLFKADISLYIKEWQKEDCFYPKVYKDLVDAVFHEEWGFTYLTPWIEGYTDTLKESTSCKVIGHRIYFLLDGHMELQSYTIPKGRRTRLINALLSGDARASSQYSTSGKAEVFLLDGTRIALYGNTIIQENQESIVFRKYTVKDHSFEKQEKYHTLPKGSGELFREMVKCGYNVAFTGAVRTTKTTQLVTWQSYEDKSLEGVAVQTDPEIKFDQVCEGAPIIPYIADGEELRTLIKPIMRSDADYIIMAEARDGVALYIAMKAANKGTRRVKMTYHTTDVLDFCHDIAEDIANDMGGNKDSYVAKVAKSFQLVFQFIQLADKDKKRLKSIYALGYDRQQRKVIMKPLCKYNFESDNWTWQDGFLDIHEEIGMEESPESYKRVRKIIKELAQQHPMKEEEGRAYIT